MGKSSIIKDRAVSCRTEKYFVGQRILTWTKVVLCGTEQLCGTAVSHGTEKSHVIMSSFMRYIAV